MCRSEAAEGDKPVQRCYRGLKSGVESKLLELERQLNGDVSDVRPSPPATNIADDAVVVHISLSVLFVVIH